MSCACYRFTVPNHVEPVYFSAEAIVAIGPPFNWSADMTARNVYLVSGQEIIVLDTPEHLAAAVAAMGGED